MNVAHFLARIGRDTDKMVFSLRVRRVFFRDSTLMQSILMLCALQIDEVIEKRGHYLRNQY
jgi:hypothetical protein